MQRLIYALCAVVLLPWSAAASVADLGGRIVASDGWVRWDVPLVEATVAPCCFEIRGHQHSARTCDLDNRRQSVGTSSDDVVVSGERLSVYAHVQHGRVDRVRAFAASCPVQAATPIRALEEVTASASVAWLGARVTAGGGAAQGKHKDDTDEEALIALAYHAGDEATRALAAWVDPAQPESLRESALFWLGDLRGRAGIDIVTQHARTNPDPGTRQHAVFVLSQAESANTYPLIRAIAGSDSSGEVRGQAWFWLAQMHDSRAEADILAALHQETDEDVREQAVFALSQLDGGAADNALIAVIRGNFPREIKQKALFWLGQSGSDAALAFLDEVLR